MRPSYVTNISHQRLHQHCRQHKLRRQLQHPTRRLIPVNSLSPITLISSSLCTTSALPLLPHRHPTQPIMSAPSSSASQLTLQSTLPLQTNPPIQIPILGFGIYQSPPSRCVQSCLTALSRGYRHIDSAQFYGNEAEMGEAMRRSGLQRSEVFLTTKIMAPGGSAEKTYQKCVDSVRRVNGARGGGAGAGSDGGDEGDEYVDLFLIHTASGGPAARKEMWLALERLLAEGKTRAIGVSNYGVGHIEEMKAYARIWPPHVNQIELHPWCQQPIITAYCARNNIIIQAYSPLVRNRKSSSPVLVSIAQNHPPLPHSQPPKRPTTAQILIRYSLQKGWVPLPKSDDAGRIEENANVFGWELSEEEMAELDNLDEGERGAVVMVVRNG